MRGHRITSMGEAAPGGPPVATEVAAARSRGVVGRAEAWFAAAVTLGQVAGVVLPTPAEARHRCMTVDAAVCAGGLSGRAAYGLVLSGPAGSALVVAMAAPADAVPADDASGVRDTALPDPAVPAVDGGAGSAVAGPAAAGPVAAPLGRAVGMLDPRHRRERGHPRHGPEPMPGCTGMATLDGVSAALQAGAFGRGKGLAIMQFRNVVTDSAEDGSVSCHSDVLLSDGSLHRAEYGLHRVGRGTRLRIEVAGDRVPSAPAGSEAPARGGAVPVPPDVAPADAAPPAAGPSDAARPDAAPPGVPGPALPAT